MKLKLIAIGKTKSPHFLGAAAEYAQRLAHYLPFDFAVAKDERQALKMIDSGDVLVVCDKSGTQRSSEELAEYIDGHRSRGTKTMTVFIGGPAGIGKPIMERANDRLSLSKMTLPHELAQVVVLEQLYRALTILKGEPYHK